MKCVSENKDLQIFVLKLKPLEFVGRGSETQLQVVENFNKFTSQDKG